LKKILQILLLIIFVLISFFLNAQDITVKENQKQDSVFRKALVAQVDVIDILQHLFYKNKNKEEERRIEKHEPGEKHISILPALGYTLQTGFAALISGNAAFYTGNLEGQKLSNILTSVTYSQYKQFIVPLQASIWTKGNKYNIVTDCRYMNYPSTTYGLGGNTTLKSGYTIDFSYIKIHQSIFRSIGNNFYAGLGYYFDYLWSIKEVGLAPGTKTVFQRYGLASREIASGPALRLLYDSRINQINPENGFYSNIVFRPNFKFFGSQNNWQSLLLEFRKYIKLSVRSKNVLALWSYNWLTTSGHPPYLLLPSTGWDDAFNTGRGYIQGRFRGRNMIYLEAEYRFGITHNGLLGGVVFANAQGFSKETYLKLNDINPAWGAGLRIKLNKFSGTNLCIDYGVGLNGSRGFFVNLNEVF
jgi:hypothetical protein